MQLHPRNALDQFRKSTEEPFHYRMVRQPRRPDETPSRPIIRRGVRKACRLTARIFIIRNLPVQLPSSSSSSSSPTVFDHQKIILQLKEVNYLQNFYYPFDEMMGEESHPPTEMDHPIVNWITNHRAKTHKLINNGYEDATRAIKRIDFEESWLSPRVLRPCDRDIMTHRRWGRKMVLLMVIHSPYTFAHRLLHTIDRPLGQPEPDPVTQSDKINKNFYILLHLLSVFCTFLDAPPPVLSSYNNSCVLRFN